MGSRTGQDNESRGSGSSGLTGYIVDYSSSFLKYYNTLGSVGAVNQLDCIDDFIEHFESNGLGGWKGKVASSDRLPPHYPDREKIIEHAQKHCLWHVHIGDPCFKPSRYRDYLVSDGVLHFQKQSKYVIKLVSVSYHDPMELPEEEDLE